MLTNINEWIHLKKTNIFKSLLKLTHAHYEMMYWYRTVNIISDSVCWCRLKLNKKKDRAASCMHNFTFTLRVFNAYGKQKKNKKNCKLD